MIKKLSLIFIFSIILNASILDNKIESLIGSSEFNENKGLIEFLFKNANNFYINDRVNYIAVMEKLKENGLLKVGLNSPKEVFITFKISDDPVKSMKIISDSLTTLGYYHYFTKNLFYDEYKTLTWTISLKTEAAIDPLMLSKELAKNSCQLIDIKQEGYIKWMYVIDTSYSTLSDTQVITNNERVDFRKPLTPYFIKVSNAKSIKIISKWSNQWFPQVVFYDKHLSILNIIKENNKKSSLQLEIPEGTTYIKIDDLYTLANISRGLSVIIKE
ncbi:hypothetical protein CRV08_07440 [Halarcobacter ebronensis]|uniref:Periplasmic protein n=1 Tax=Halarcobacter ebronensis TaxID=1462615 RepID=A0A4Q0YDT3_9BACT|nr:hypothetical protein [Halarcobacter ebronensis]RXJ68646.1 hypothetical protein CRV08_07440 [Halarcobacter ebronensis]